MSKYPEFVHEHESVHDWRPRRAREHWRHFGAAKLLGEMWEYPETTAVFDVEESESLAEEFSRLAAEWSQEIGHVSSLTERIAHPKYRAIINLGWPVVPYLIEDLQVNHRFWFPALQEITNVRPFDKTDDGNVRRMTESWAQWWKKRSQLQL